MAAKSSLTVKVDSPSACNTLLALFSYPFYATTLVATLSSQKLRAM